MNVEDAQRLVGLILEKSSSIRREWSPHTPTVPQRTFIDTPALEALYGGAAGGGKSDALLWAALQYVNVPSYSAVLFRRTFPQLSGAGGLIPRAHEWLRETEATWREKTMTYTFPSGATLKFGHMQHEDNKYDYQGHEYQFIGFDELTQFTETQYRYLLSRLRRLEGFQVPLRVRSATNPGGHGHDWVKSRFVDEKTRGERVFIPATLEDNPYLDQEAYEVSLSELDPLTYDQLRKGLWVRDRGGLIYPYSKQLNYADMLPEPGEVPERLWEESTRTILGVDLGASEEKPTTSFCVVWFNRLHPNVFVAESEKESAMIPSTIADRIRLYQDRYGGFSEIVVDTGSLGKGYKGEFEQRHGIPITDALKRDKLGYRKLIRGDLMAGRLQIIEAANQDLVSEMGSLVWNQSGLDNEPRAPNHLTDAMLYAWRSAKHFISREFKRVPERGTPEWVAKEESDMKKRRIISLQRERSRRNQPWWKRRGA